MTAPTRLSAAAACATGAPEACLYGSRRVLSLPDMETTKDEAALRAEQVAKAITDLDELVQAVLVALPPSKPWQRQLLVHLNEIDRLTQVLRMTVSMARAPSEVSEAVQQVRVALRVAQRYVGTGRADSGTKAAILLSCELGLRIESTLG